MKKQKFAISFYSQGKRMRITEKISKMRMDKKPKSMIFI